MQSNFEQSVPICINAADIKWHSHACPRLLVLEAYAAGPADAGAIFGEDKGKVAQQISVASFATLSLAFSFTQVMHAGACHPDQVMTCTSAVS